MVVDNVDECEVIGKKRKGYVSSLSGRPQSLIEGNQLSG